MLIELRIRDYAVLNDVSVELGPGLSALSGETGAGKSIIVGALSLLMGERASSEVVRAGSERAVVEGVFDVSGLSELGDHLDQLGIETPDGLLILKREVAAEGRNRAWVNGSPATATVVGELGSALVDLHGQHEHQTLLRGAEQRGILDAFAEQEGQVARVAALHGTWRELRERRTALSERRRELESRADFLRFQLSEIEEVAPEEGEEEVLEAEASRLEHSEELMREGERVHDALYGGEDAVSERIAALRSVLRRLSRLDAGLEATASLLDDAYHQVVEAGRAMGSYAAGVDHDPARLEALRKRQDRLFRLKRKYGPELTDVLETAERVRNELSELEASVLDADTLDRRIGEAEEALRAAAGELARARAEAAGRLEREMGALLPELGMDGAVFEVALIPLDEPGPGGAERVEFRASLNPGFEPKPLSRIASGGELSRVMLALKAILARVDRVPTLVFDEIDAGIGGVVAGRVAETLREVAEHHQVFVITHLPQLASRAHGHLLVEKDAEEGIAATRVRALDGEERVREIARMLGGDPDSTTSRDHARELLRTA